MTEQHKAKSTDLLISLFLQSLKKQRMSERTLKAYASDLRAFFHDIGLSYESLDMPKLGTIQTEDLQSYFSKLAVKGLKFASVKRSAAAIKKFFTFLRDESILQSNPAASLAIRSARRAILSAEQILSIFQYLQRRQQTNDGSDIIQYRRNELILLLMILYGVRQYQIAGLRLSAIQKEDKSVSLTISKRFRIQLDGFVMDKLRAYLEIRKSNADTIFLVPLRKKHADHSVIRVLLTELNYALRFSCTPRLLHNTYLHLQQHPQERRNYLQRIMLQSSSHTYGAAANA